MSAFDILDKDGDGYIDEDELAQIMGFNNESGHSVMKKLISDIDDNRDNKIDFTEFKKMITKLSKGDYN